MEASNCEPCNARYKQKTAINWCTECEETLCLDCTENHQVQKVSRHHHLVDINTRPREFNIPSSCQKHKQLQFEYFCFNHDILCCKECLAESHRTCDKFMSIDKASVNAKYSHIYVDSMRQINHLIESLKSFSNNRKSNIVTLENEAGKIRMTIGSIKQRIIKHLDVLAESLLTELDQLKDHNVSQLKQQADEIDDILTKTRIHKYAFDFIREHGTDKQAFLLTRSSDQLLHIIETKVNSLTKNAVEATLIFNNNQLERMMAAIGTIEIVNTPYSILFMPYKQRQSQNPVDIDQQLTSLTFQHGINLKQKQKVCVVGMAVTDNSLLLCDACTQKLHICDESGAHLSSIDLSYAPWDIATLPSTTTAVLTSRDKPYIQFIDIQRRLKLGNTRIDGIACGGIATTKDTILLGGRCQIFILDHQGNTQRTIHPNLDLERTIWYISMGPNGYIYFTDGNGLHCTTLHGFTEFSYKSPDLLSPRKVTLDKRGNVYVVGRSSNNMFKLTSAGKFVDIVLWEIDGLDSPLAICYNNDYSKFYVANKDGTTVMIFKVN